MGDPVKCMHNVDEEQMKTAHHAKVFSTRGEENCPECGSVHVKLVHHLVVVDEEDRPIHFNDGRPVQWSGRTYGQFLTNAGFMVDHYGLEGDIDQSGIIRE